VLYFGIFNLLVVLLGAVWIQRSRESEEVGKYHFPLPLSIQTPKKENEKTHLHSNYSPNFS